MAVNPGTAGTQPHWRNAVRLTRLVRLLQPHIIHCTLADASLAARVAGRITGTPVLESLVNISHEPVRTVDNPSVRPWKLMVWRTVDRLTMNWVRHFHALSLEVARSWVETVGIDSGQITVIPRGVDVKAIDAVRSRDRRRKIRERLGITPDQQLILMVGRQEPQKGHRLAMRAMASVTEGASQARLVLVGRPGNSSIAIERQIQEANLGQYVRDLGPRTDVGELMEAADLFLFPSLFEGLGVSLLEAMAHGLTPVVLDRPPMNEVVTSETGYLAKPDGSDLAVQILTALADDEERTKRGQRASKLIRERFDIAATVKRTEELYISLLSGRQ